MSNFQYIAAGEEGFKNDMLDELLAAGYYRSQHLMFTCNDTVINEEEDILPVFWLRTLINKCKPGKSANTILKKCSGFTVNFCKAYIDNEIENLYTAYRQHITFAVSNTCENYLHQQMIPQPFNSMMVQVHDNNNLIAAGYFDEGSCSIAGIMNIYNPQYNFYSLGKFLMLQKLKYALSQKLNFYYTGYISTKSTHFDYKVFPDVHAVEVWLPVERLWAPYHLLNKTFLEDYYEKFLEQ